MAPRTREAFLDAAYRCIARVGLAKTTLDEVAREAGVSRPTVYRHFPGGRQALLREVVIWEAQRFLASMTAAVAHHTDLADLVEELIVVAGEGVHQHAVLQKVLETEPDRLLPLLVTGLDALLALIRPLLRQALERDPSTASRGDIDRVADHLARLVLSVVGAPAGRDLSDRQTVRRFVDTELLGFLA